MAKVFIGSTSRDLHAYRQAAIDECNRLGLVPIAMEFFPAIGVGATAGCKRKLDEADLYVGILAHRYGFIEAGQTASVTEIEFDYAGEPRGLERLCFLTDPGKSDPALMELAEPEHRERMADFRARVEASVIRQYFTSLDDFRGKVRLALQNWMQRTPALRGPQPPLGFQLLAPTPENRLRYGARRTPFAGRAREMASLRAFLDEPAAVSWIVVSGPAGSGKSRLAQELCTDVSPQWRAGFLLMEPAFTHWLDWRPEGPTLIVVDYASERVDDIRALFNSLVQQGGDALTRTPVRVVLVERDAQGPWMDRLIGRRSDGYALEQSRSPARTIELGPLSDDALWQSVEGVLGEGAARPQLREQLIVALGALDPERRPLFALLAADAIAAGRSIAAWDRERLLRDVLGRERETWAAHAVTREYENLLALATLTGGLTEDVLGAQPPGVALPSFRDFDRGVYRAMTGADLEGDTLPPLKPDIVGEFFVLEHVRGRNERVTAQVAAEYVNAAWRVRGGSRRVTRFDVLTHVLPTGLPIFLRRLVDDYVDHPATAALVAKPAGDGVDMFFWPELAAHAVGRLSAAGRMREALARYDELTALTPEQCGALHATGAIVSATLALLPRALRGDTPVQPADLLARLASVDPGASSGTAVAFANAVADAVPELMAAGRDDLAGELTGRVRAMANDLPGEADLRSTYARLLSLMATGTRALEARERSFERLRELCEEFRQEPWLFVWLARAAGSLCREYVASSERIDDADRMNRVVRATARLRGEQQVVRVTASPEGSLPVRSDMVQDDLRTIRLELAVTDALLIPAFVRTGRENDASVLLAEIQRVSYRGDPDFAAAWALGVGGHADASAAVGHPEQVAKALDGISEVAAAFPGDTRFPAIASSIALNALKRAEDPGNPQFASMFEFLARAAAAPDADAQVVAAYAEGTLFVCSTRQERGETDEAIRLAAQAAWALRSPAARARWLERGNESTAAEIERWIEGILALAPRTAE